MSHSHGNQRNECATKINPHFLHRIIIISAHTVTGTWRTTTMRKKDVYRHSQRYGLDLLMSGYSVLSSSSSSRGSNRRKEAGLLSQRCFILLPPSSAHPHRPPSIVSSTWTGCEWYGRKCFFNLFPNFCVSFYSQIIINIHNNGSFELTTTIQRKRIA